MAINVLDVVPITELRQHIEMDSDDRDAVLTRYAQGSLDYCIRFCDDPRWKTASDLPSQVVNAMLLFFCDAFEHRGAQTDVQLYSNARANDLLLQVRNFRGVIDPPEERGS